MNKLAVIIVFLGFVALACSAKSSSFGFSGKKLRCGVNVESTGDVKKNPHHVCRKIERKEYYNMDFSVRLNVINKCLCTLIPQPLFWLAMVDDNAELVYNRLMEMLGASSDDDEVEMLKKLDKFASNNPGNEFRDQYITSVRSKLNDQSIEKAEKFLSTTCLDLKRKFDTIWEYIEKATEAAKSLNFLYRLTAYDENLFKTMLVWRGCQALNKVKPSEILASLAENMPK